MRQHTNASRLDGSGRSTRGAQTAQGRRGGRRGAVVAAVAAAGLLACTGAQAMQSTGGPNSQSQAYFVCGNGPCGSPYGAAFEPTPIDDIKLGGGYWDVTWSQAQPATSPFVVSTTAAKPGQPLTGIDAANALVAFYDRIPMPVGYQEADVGEQAITAFGPGAVSGPLDLAPNNSADFAVPYPGFGAQAVYVNHIWQQVSAISTGANGVGEYTIWTPVAAPTHVPELDATGLGGAAAMLAFGIALLRGRRRAVAGAALVGALGAGGALAMQGTGGPNSQSQAYFVCLPSEQAICGDPYNEAFTTTPIDDIKLGGGYWDVTWSQTAPATSPFVLSTTTAKPGQPLTGIDAANALVAFYDRIPRPTGYCCADMGEEAITAFSPGAASFPLGEPPSTPGDVATPYPGYGATAEYVGNLAKQIGSLGIGLSYEGEYTIWTPVAAPTRAPELDAGGLGGAAAMLAFGIALLRGRRRAVAGAALVGALSVGGAQAQVLMCGASACADPYDQAYGYPGYNNGVLSATGIDDLKVGGGYWDVTYTLTQPATSPFVFSYGTAKPGQPLTGIDAAIAISNFYSTFVIPPNNGPIWPDNSWNFATAFRPYTAPNSINGYIYDYAETIPAFSPADKFTVSYIPNDPGGDGPGALFTKWTAVAPPTHAPELSATGLSGALALLATGVLVLTGRKAAG